MMCGLYTKMHSNETNFKAIIYVYIPKLPYKSPPEFPSLLFIVYSIFSTHFLNE